MKSNFNPGDIFIVNMISYPSYYVYSFEPNKSYSVRKGTILYLYDVDKIGVQSERRLHFYTNDGNRGYLFEPLFIDELKDGYISYLSKGGGQ